MEGLADLINICRWSGAQFVSWPSKHRQPTQLPPTLQVFPSPSFPSPSSPYFSSASLFPFSKPTISRILSRFSLLMSSHRGTSRSYSCETINLSRKSKQSGCTIDNHVSCLLIRNVFGRFDAETSRCQQDSYPTPHFQINLSNDTDPVADFSGPVFCTSLRFTSTRKVVILFSP